MADNKEFSVHMKRTPSISFPLSFFENRTLSTLSSSRVLRQEGDYGIAQKH